MLASGRVRKAPERSRSERTTSATSVGGAAADPWYGIGTTAIGSADVLLPTISISRPCCWADASAGRSVKRTRANQRSDFIMGTATLRLGGAGQGYQPPRERFN